MTKTFNIIHIDLSSKKASTIAVKHSVLRKYLGGRGLAAYFFNQYSKNDPSPICIFPGLLTGIGAPSADHTSIFTKSAHTGLIIDAKVGGNWGAFFKQNGWVGIVIEGQSQAPVEVSIKRETIEITATSKDTFFNTSFPQKNLSTLHIGKAALAGTSYSTVLVDNSFLALRGGAGPVFASKKVFAIHVHCPTENGISVRQSYVKKFTKAKADIVRLTDASPYFRGESGLTNMGDTGLLHLLQARRMLPTNNFNQTFYHPLEVKDVHFSNSCMFGCTHCHIMCHQKSAHHTPLPGFEALSHFTALIGNSDIDLAITAYKICHENGIDPISAGSTLACKSELDDEDITGETLRHHLESLSQNDDIDIKHGALAVEGLQKPEMAMVSKGLELSSLDPRGAYGLALSFAVSTIGGCWRRALTIGYEILRKPIPLDRFSFSSKARMVFSSENSIAILDSFGVCNNLFFAASLEEYAGFVEAASKGVITQKDLKDTGERIVYLERYINECLDATIVDDLPERFFKQAGSFGPGFAVNPINRFDFLAAKQRYYRLRGLTDSGRTTPENRSRLELF